mgnify:CR=1 FL=1
MHAARTEIMRIILYGRNGVVVAREAGAARTKMGGVRTRASYVGWKARRMDAVGMRVRRVYGCGV